MTRSRIKRLLAVGGATIIASCALPGSANAQLFSPCLLLGSPMPPPCIVFDYKRLADLATRNAQEINKVKGTVQTITNAKNATQGIVSDVRDLASFRPDLRLPSINTDMGPLLSKAKGSIGSMAQTTSNSIFAGVDATVKDNQQAASIRQGLATDASVDAYAYGLGGVTRTDTDNTRYAALSRSACKSADLRTDWAVNSSIKLELVNARARQSELLTAYLRMQSANNVKSMSTSLAKGRMAGTVKDVAQPETQPIDQSVKVDLLRDLVAKASSIMASVQVVQMATSVTQQLKDVITSYGTAQVAKQNKINTLYSYATSWAKNSKKCSAQQIVDTVTQRLGTMNTQLTSLSTVPIDQLAGAFKDRNIDVTKMLENDVDPRQFIGTWEDPLRYQNTYKLANDLKNDDIRGSLGSCIKGDDDNQEFMDLVAGKSYENKYYPKNDARRYVYEPGLNDLILDEAWQKAQAADAQVRLNEIGQTVETENGNQGKQVTESGSEADLKAIVAQANELGSAITQGQDAGSIERAKDLLNQLQGIVGGGVKLPDVSVDVGEATPAPSQETTPVDQQDPQQYDPRAPSTQLQ
jgi:hypothetical protein